MEPIDSSQFRNRFVSMVLGGQGFPKKPLDRHILFISATFGLEPGRQYSEREINDKLRAWMGRFGQHVSLDHVTLRRFLVDEHYLTRDSSGERYELATADQSYTWDSDLRALDLDLLVEEARQERERKKQQYMRNRP